MFRGCGITVFYSLSIFLSIAWFVLFQPNFYIMGLYGSVIASELRVIRNMLHFLLIQCTLNLYWLLGCVCDLVKSCDLNWHQAGMDSVKLPN